MAATRERQAMKEWSVAVGFGQLPSAAATLDARISDLAERLAGMAPAIGAGESSLTVRLAVEADDAVAAAASAVPEVLGALDAVGLGAGPVTDLEVTEWSSFEKRLEEPTIPELVGITEIAGILGTSRQRASELARSPRFPAPLADLAAGPVWLKPNIARFVQEWDRRPGRPKAPVSERAPAQPRAS